MKTAQSVMVGAMMLGLGACQQGDLQSLNAAHASNDSLPAPQTMTQTQLLQAFAHVWTGLEIVQGLGDLHRLANHNNAFNHAGRANDVARVQSLSYCTPYAAQGSVYHGEYSVQDTSSHTSGNNVSRQARLVFDGRLMAFNTGAPADSGTNVAPLRVVFDAGSVFGDTAVTARGTVTTVSKGNVRVLSGKHTYQLNDFNWALSEQGAQRSLSRGIALEKMLTMQVANQQYSVLQVQPMQWQKARFPMAGNLIVHRENALCEGGLGIVFKSNSQFELRCGASVFTQQWTDAPVQAAFAAER